MLALLGLAILCLCTLPAVRKQQRLEREHARLEERSQHLTDQVERLRRELGDRSGQKYLAIKAARALLSSGAGYIRTRDARLAEPR